MDEVETSQRKAEPIDEEFFRLFGSAVEHGIKLVRNLQAQNAYFGGHSSYHKVYRAHDTPMPGFTPGNLVDYGRAFDKIATSATKLEEERPIADLVNYALSTDQIQKHFRLAKYTLAGDEYTLPDKQVRFFFVQLYASVVDMCLHKLVNGDFSINWFKPWYREIERGILHTDLEVDLVVPILALSFDFESRWLDDQRVGIVRMSNEFQEARFLDQQLDIKVPSAVTGCSSHAFVIKGRRIKNDGFLQVWHEAQTLVKKEISLINSIFGLLKAATGYATGYSQFVLLPLMWAHRYLAHLPVVISESVRAYPTAFDDGVWLATPPVVPSNQLDSIAEILTTSSTFTNRRMKLANSRLNSCMLRENLEDKILDACIGLEALFSDSGKQEMTHKLALRIAAVSRYFEQGGCPKRDIFAAVKKIYSLRSSIAHGESGSSKDATVTVDGIEYLTVDFAIDLLRECIIALGSNPVFLSPEKIDFYILLDSHEG